MNDQQQPQDTEALMKEIAEERLKNKQLQEQIKNMREGTPPEQPDQQPTVEQPKITDFSQDMEQNMTGTQGGDTAPSSTEERLAQTEAELALLKKEKAVEQYAADNNVSPEGKKIMMEGALDKNMDIEDAALYAQGKLAQGAGEAKGTPSPPETLSEIQKQEAADEAAKNRKPSEMSDEELRRNAVGEMENLNANAQSMTA